MNKLKDLYQIEQKCWPEACAWKLPELHYASNDIYCFKTQFNACDPSISKNLVSRINKSCQVKALSFKKIQDRNRFIVARAMLNLLLSKYCQQKFKLIIDTNGKPILENHELEFNISHSENVVLIAVSRSSQIGIDIEKISTTLELDSYRAIFHESELKKFNQIFERKDSTEFFKIWTHKEAISKALGIGLSLNFNELALCNRETSLCIEHISNCFPQEWSLHTLNPYDDYVGAIASPKPKLNILGFTMPYEQIKSFYEQQVD